MTTMMISPKKPHFVKPMGPGFKQGIKIPKAFLKYLEKDKHEYAILRRADKKWRVKVNDDRLEDGWEKFAEQHDLQDGDVLVFRHEGDMEFKVSIFDFFDQCEREYKGEQQKTQNVGETSKKLKSKEAATHEPLGRSHFVCTLPPYCFSRDSLCIPKQFARANGLFDIKERHLIVTDERQRSWNVILRAYRDNVYLRSGWNSIRDANCLKKGDHITFEIVTDGNKPIWKMHSKISEEDASIIRSRG